MKKMISIIISALILMTSVSVSAQGYVNPNIKLTEGNLNKMLSTLPGWVNTVKAAGLNSNPSAANALYQNNRINAYLRSQGWGNPYDFYSVLTRVSMAMAWIAILANPQISEEQRRQMLPQMEATVSQLDAREKALVKRNAARIFRAMQAASGESE